MASYLDFEGKYDANRRFVIHNWTIEDVNSFWDGRPINIKVGDMYECEHAIAYKLTKEIVDREMFRVASEEASKIPDFAAREKLRERLEMATLSRDLRKPYEDKTISEIKAGQESPIMTKLRDEIRAEERIKAQNMSSNVAAGIPASGEFEDVKPA